MEYLGIVVKLFEFLNNWDLNIELCYKIINWNFAIEN
jgi:hypothetical protein